MFGKSRTSGLAKPKKLHSLEYLKYLHSVLQKNRNVNDQNNDTLVEALRLIGEILIWGDQNDSTVMDFFLEKNILEFFLQYMDQCPGRRIYVQLLQTLNILFENITNQTAIYYLLSNNHTNAIITHHFDFSDEEVMAYYISFLKILSFRLNPNTINFFYNEQRREFDLYVEAIKLFNHSESMVRIAVRTITLNVHRVKDEAALEFIHHQTSITYFSNLVWFIGNTILEIDRLLSADQKSESKLKDLVAEHIDHLHYLNDLLSLDIQGLNEVLCDQLLRRLFVPLYMHSLIKQHKISQMVDGVDTPRLSFGLAVFVLTHVYLILHNPDLVRLLTEAIFMGDLNITGLLPSHESLESPVHASPNSTNSPNINTTETSMEQESQEIMRSASVHMAKTLIAATSALRASRQEIPGKRFATYCLHAVCRSRPLIFAKPANAFEQDLSYAKGVTPALMTSLWPANLSPLRLVHKDVPNDSTPAQCDNLPNESFASICHSRSSGQLQKYLSKETSIHRVSSSPAFQNVQPNDLASPSETDLGNYVDNTEESSSPDAFKLQGRPFLRALFRSLDVGSGSDYDSLLSLLLLSAIKDNKGLDDSTLHLGQLIGPQPGQNSPYNPVLVTRLIELVGNACKAGSQIRQITLRLTVELITFLVCDPIQGCQLLDEHFAELISAREEAMMVLRSYFQNDGLFLDMFESELSQIQSTSTSITSIGMDASLLLPLRASSIMQPTSAKASEQMKSLQQTYNRPLSNPAFRLPQNEREHIQRAISVYLLIHIWLECLLRSKSDHTSPNLEQLASDKLEKHVSLKSLFSAYLSSVPGLAGLCNIPDPKSTTSPVKAGDKLDLSSETLIGCIVERDGNHEKRFLVTYGQHLVLVEPDSKQIGWGVITFIGPLQDLDAQCDPADNRCLHVTIHAPGHLSAAESSPVHQPNVSRSKGSKPSLMVARFLFEDHIRCLTARQLLIRGRMLVRQTKLRKIAGLLDFSAQYIRETFLVGNLASGMNYNSLPNFANPEGTVRSNKLIKPSGSSTKAGDFSISPRSINSIRYPSPKETSNPSPGNFLMDRRSRTQNNLGRDRINPDVPIPLISLTAFVKNHTSNPVTVSSTPTLIATSDTTINITNSNMPNSSVDLANPTYPNSLYRTDPVQLLPDRTTAPMDSSLNNRNLPKSHRLLNRQMHPVYSVNSDTELKDLSMYDDPVFQTSTSQDSNQTHPQATNEQFKSSTEIASSTNEENPNLVPQPPTS